MANTVKNQYYVVGKSFDHRLNVPTLQAFSSIKPVAYEGMLTYVVEDGKFYVYNGTNFDEFKSGNDVVAVAIEDGKVKITLEDGTVKISDAAFVDTDTCKIDTVNGSDAGDFDIIAPTVTSSEGAEKGQVLVYDGPAATPKWVDVNTIVNHPDIVVDDGTL